MRITQNMTSENSLYNIQKGQERLNNLQESISSGQKVNRPSDDPIASQLLVQIGDKLKSIDQYSSNIDKSTTWLNYTSTALQGMSDIITQANKVAGTINTGSSDPGIRQSAHDQLVDLKKQIVDMANTQFGDQYIFAGANNTTPPFSNANNNYGGDSTQLSVEIAQNTTQTLNVTGDRLLKGTGASPSYGSIDILKTFDDLIAAVGDNVTPSNVPAISQGSQDLQDGAKQLNIATSDILSRTTRLGSMSKLNDNNKNTLLSIASNTQNVDLAALGVELNNQTTAFNASLSATAKISQMSLLNYLP
ncbi:MAG: flagellar hook-associated protein FlgL [Geobacteraceae bacterium]|nr:flagellar hook-associated protein FlgL [Geobacteraceae bacterium]